MIDTLYADGGCIGGNPSALGGTWAYRLLSGGIVVAEQSGVITPPEAGLSGITNNLTELLAVVTGLEQLPDDFAGMVCSDSWVTLQRVFHAAPLRGVPPWLVERLRTQLRRLDMDGIRYTLLDGHPTREHLAAGVGKRGQPVSEHNVWCDKACQAESRRFQAQQMERAA